HAFLIWRQQIYVNSSTGNIHASVLCPVLWHQLFIEHDSESDMAHGRGLSIHRTADCRWDFDGRIFYGYKRGIQYTGLKTCKPVYCRHTHALRRTCRHDTCWHDDTLSPQGRVPDVLRGNNHEIRLP